MSTLEQYNQVFHKIFSIDDSFLTSLRYKQTPEWNSMAHIALVSQIEATFDVDFDMEDIYAFTSYNEGKTLLTNRFGIVLE